MFIGVLIYTRKDVYKYATINSKTKENIKVHL